jgi:hypothetical protein
MSKVERSDPMLPVGTNVVVTFLGLQNQAIREAVRHGHQEMLQVILNFVQERAPGQAEAAWKECWELVVE